VFGVQTTIESINDNIVWAALCVIQFVFGPTGGIARYWGHCHCCCHQGKGHLIVLTSNSRLVDVDGM
jgi:hypothetical protein